MSLLLTQEVQPNQARHQLIYGLHIQPKPSVEYRLMHQDLKTGVEIQVAEGINPSWSPDGSKIAYLGLDGLYVLPVESDGAEPIQLVDRPIFNPRDASWFSAPFPSWSPDGKWLVYHRCDTGRFGYWENVQIYKVASDGGPEEVIYHGGEFPSWRP